MSLLYEEKIAKRFAKIKPADFDFYTELDSVIREAFLFNKEGKPVEFWNQDQTALSIAYIFLCYGMFELKSTICTILLSPALEKLITRASVELAMRVMEGKKEDDL